jgi:hypothetical protein
MLNYDIAEQVHPGSGQHLLCGLGHGVGRLPALRLPHGARASVFPRGAPAVSILEPAHIDCDLPMSRLFLSRNIETQRTRVGPIAQI